VCNHPERYLHLIAGAFDLPAPDEWQLPDQLVGHFPSGGARGGWRELWSDEDEAWFLTQVPSEFWGVYVDEN